MTYQGSVDYLRHKAARFREMAMGYAPPLSEEIREIAAEFEARAAELEKGRSAETMELAYRVYFWSATSKLVGREDFAAEDDDTAMAIAETLCDACSDVSDSYELWQGARVVAARSIASLQQKAAALTAKTQAAVAEREERLLDSKWAIARSRRLLERLRNQPGP